MSVYSNSCKSAFLGLELYQFLIYPLQIHELPIAWPSNVGSYKKLRQISQWHLNYPDNKINYMKISNFLPQFTTPRLLITAGKQEACFYIAQEDKVEKVHSIKINKSEYTDREGRFDKRASGRMMHSGSAYELHDDEELTKSFTKQLAEDTAALTVEHAVRAIYLFCPTYLANRLEAGLPNDLQAKLEYIFYGNYHNQHPFVLLSKIQEHSRLEKDSSIVEPIKTEALNILKNTETFLG
jgi:hypothetical protein